jgi:tRNA (guanine37-N1)-methyltransferase
MSSLSVHVFTVFPWVVESYCDESLLGRARRSGVIEVAVHDLRSAAQDPHRSVDDAPFGGGPGMVLAPRPVFEAVETVHPPRPLYLLSPGGRRLDQDLVRELHATGTFTLLCGRYEGVDQRIVDHLVDGEISIGDYVLAGGELAALVVVEAVARLVPGVLGNEESTSVESFADGLLEHPQYTRPAEFRGWVVPEVLRSGDHARIEAWRRASALSRTCEQRPDLIARRGGLTEAEVRLLGEHGYPVKTGESPAPSAAPPGPASSLSRPRKHQPPAEECVRL